ncbi:MAG: DUF4418 family protein [Candidatus Saganbacteria bacterium]|nr:DUF4418 family protein [Candidatus Saganbacteria bacterium]
MNKNRIFSLIYILIGLLVIIVPSYILPVCNNPMMCCRAHTLPVLVLLGVILIILSGMEFFLDK